MDYTYEVDLANGKTVSVSRSEKMSKNGGIASGAIGESSISGGDEPMGSYSTAELLEQLLQSPIFTAINGDAHASSAIVSVRKAAEFIDLPMILSK
jgi:hypothetical protein